AAAPCGGGPWRRPRKAPAGTRPEGPAEGFEVGRRRRGGGARRGGGRRQGGRQGDRGEGRGGRRPGQGPRRRSADGGRRGVRGGHPAGGALRLPRPRLPGRGVRRHAGGAARGHGLARVALDRGPDRRHHELRGGAAAVRGVDRGRPGWRPAGRGDLRPLPRGALLGHARRRRPAERRPDLRVLRGRRAAPGGGGLRSAAQPPLGGALLPGDGAALAPAHPHCADPRQCCHQLRLGGLRAPGRVVRAGPELLGQRGRGAAGPGGGRPRHGLRGRGVRPGHQASVRQQRPRAPGAPGRAVGGGRHAAGRGGPVLVRKERTA
ncbi:unnamed protein product, partial [Prorocentrum cordatum]